MRSPTLSRRWAATTEQRYPHFDEVWLVHTRTSQSHSLPDPFPKTADEVEAADWGDRGATVVERFDDGGFVVSFDYAGGKYDPLGGGWYYVPPGPGDAALGVDSDGSART